MLYDTETLDDYIKKRNYTQKEISSAIISPDLLNTLSPYNNSNNYEFNVYEKNDTIGYETDTNKSNKNDSNKHKIEIVDIFKVKF